jgi:hypothetical protein
MEMDKDRYRPRQIEDDAISLINEEPSYRDRDGATVLHRWPKIPIRAVLADTGAHPSLARSAGGWSVWRSDRPGEIGGPRTLSANPRSSSSGAGCLGAVAGMRGQLPGR